MKNEGLEKVMESTLAGEDVRKLLKVFEELAERQESFLEKHSLACPKGCGSCCRDYKPSVTGVEADLAAYVLLRDDRAEEILSFLSSNVHREGCPLYREDSEYHCALYEGRSLVCRLFGCSVSQDKNGERTYRPCHWTDDRRVFSPEELQNAPVMSHYGELLEECGGREDEEEELPVALPKAVAKMRMLLSFASSPDECDNEAS